MSQHRRDRMSATTSAGVGDAQLEDRTRGSRRRSRVTDVIESAPDSVYNDGTERDSIDGQSVAPLPIKPPNNANTTPDSRLADIADLAGNSADEYYNEITTTSSNATPPPTSPNGTHALSRRRTSSHGLSHSSSHGGRSSRSRRTRSHSSVRDILRLLLSTESSESREALALLRRAQERLEIESQRANEAERRVQEANERWRLINQARLQAQADSSKANEELRLYRLQLEAAQQQIARANDMIAVTDKERAQAEDEAVKAKRLTKKYEMEREIQKAREEGRLEGMRQGRKEAQWYDRYIREREPQRVRRRYRSLGGDETYLGSEDYQGTLDEGEPYPIPRSNAPSQAPDTPLQARQQVPRSAPLGAIPAPIRSTGPHGSHMPGRIISAVAHIGKSGRRGVPEMDRNVAINPSNAPDVASIIEPEPVNALASPLPPEQTSQINRTTPTRMPEPDFDPDPSDVPPIAIPGPPRSPGHPQVFVPPDGFIPPKDDDGAIRLPPPHEIQHPPPTTPHSHNSPLVDPMNFGPPVDPELPQREREPIPRDFGYPPGQRPRPQGRRRYQRSVAESDDSVATASLSIISPSQGRSSALPPRLSAIPEHDPRYASPSGSMRQAEAPVYPTSPRSRLSNHAEDGDTYVPGDPGLDAALAGRQSLLNGSLVRPTDLAGSFTPRSNHSRISGLKRPSHVTTPAPLAPDALRQPLYTRPRINSVASGSENSGFVGTPRVPRSREKTPVPEYNRSRPGSAANTPGQQALPEINIVPASRSESLQSRKSAINGAPEARMMSPRANRKAKSYNPQMPMPAPMPPQPEPPSPVDIPGMPKGFVPTSPVPAASAPATPILEGAPPGFVPTSPAIPPDAPPGFIPTSPAVPSGASLGFIPTSSRVPSHFPVVPPGAPSGFIPTSPAVGPSGGPPGFVPVSPVVPGGVPPGFVPASPIAPEVVQPGFAPISPTVPGPTIPTSPFPQANPIVSPNMSVTGALPVLARSPSQKLATYEKTPTVTRLGSGSGSSTTPRSPRVSFIGPNAGFNSRAASDWDTHSAWGEPQSDHQSPRPVRGPDLSASIVRPGSSLSRKDSGPIIPDPATFGTPRRSSRVDFDATAAPLPASTAPSLARSGRASSHAESRPWTPGSGLSRSQSARSDSTRAKIYPGTPRHASVTGLPPAGLGSPFSRRLDAQQEDPGEFEIVPSDDSANTLTTPPDRRRDLPPPGNTPKAPARNSLYRSPAASQHNLSLSAQGPADGPAAGPSLHKSASRQSLTSNKSYSRFDPNEYVDPAILTSGRSRLLPLPAEEPAAESAPAAAKGKKAKGKKGKGKNR